MIERQIQWLKGNGINELIICAGYLKEKIMEYVDDESRFGVSVSYSVEEAILGTGGAVKNAERLLLAHEGEGFYVINGDVLTTIDLRKLNGDNNNMHTVAAVPMRSPYGIIIAANDDEGSRSNSNYVTEFLQKPIMNDIWINAEVYYFTSEIFQYLLEVGNFEDSVLPQLARQDRLKAVKFGNSYYWRSIDSHWDLEEASKEAQS